MKIKRASERRIVRKGENGVKENIAVEPENRNKTDKPLSPDLLRRIEKIQGAMMTTASSMIKASEGAYLKQ